MQEAPRAYRLYVALSSSCQPIWRSEKEGKSMRVL